jgi:hypothetical protein
MNYRQKHDAAMAASKAEQLRTGVDFTFTEREEFIDSFIEGLYMAETHARLEMDRVSSMANDATTDECDYCGGYHDGECPVWPEDMQEEIETRVVSVEGVSAPKKIVIVMEGGVIQDIANIPAGIVIEVREFDSEGISSLHDTSHPSWDKTLNAFVSTWK